jgi:integrase
MAELTQQASAANRIFGKEAGSENGESEHVRGSAGVSPLCPQCGSKKLWRDGLRYSLFGDRIQRWLCRNCGLRFSDPFDIERAWSTFERVDRVDTKAVKASANKDTSCQICDILAEESKNLALAENPPTTGLAGASEQTTDFRGKIIEYVWYMKKQGYAEATIQGRSKLVQIMVKRGADLLNPESIKETIAKQNWSTGRKNNAVDAYSCFLRLFNGKWDPPNYKRVRKLPFIPAEVEIDQLIAACSTRMSTLLQLLKETGIRIGEAWKLQWIDLDTQNSTIAITPEKGSNPRMFKISGHLVAMLNCLPKKDNYIFGTSSLRSKRRRFERQRQLIAEKLKNPRILHITFHTFRHWKATMEYHKTKDILHVMQLLGHRSITNTLVYTHLIDFKNDEYTSRVAKTIEEARQLLEQGFDYITEMENIKIFRKRK